MRHWDQKPSALLAREGRTVTLTKVTPTQAGLWHWAPGRAGLQKRGFQDWVTSAAPDGCHSAVVSEGNHPPPPTVGEVAYFHGE